jgi:NADP-dependent 3-hydroxy acid dehydrogenase YdfG
MPFPYKTVLVTGATSGIGRALAERMINSGIFVIAVGRRKERLDELVQQHGSDKVAAEVFDVSEIDKMEEWAKKYVIPYSLKRLEALFVYGQPGVRVLGWPERS